MCNESSAVQSRHPFGLGEWHVEPTLDQISRGNEIVQVAPRVMQVLLCLSANAGEVVTKQQLISDVWGTQFVSEAALTRCIVHLRRILGDDADRPRYVQNIPRRGYRLLMPIEASSETIESRNEHPPMCWMSHCERRFMLAEGVSIIGRAPDATVRIDSTMVSRHHARVTVRGALASVEDLGSKNGTFVDGQRLEEPRDLHDRDQITVGPMTMVFRVHNPQGSTETAHTPEEDGLQ